MIIQRLFSSKAQKARQRKFDLEMAEKAEDGYKYKRFKEPSEADRIRKGRKAVKTDKTDLGFKLTDNINPKKHVREINEHINKAKPGDVLEASKFLGDTEAKKRVGERLSRLGGPDMFEHIEKGHSLKHQAKNIERLKKGGKIALATGGVVAAGVGAKKLADKKKAKKDDNSKK